MSAKASAYTSLADTLGKISVYAYIIGDELNVINSTRIYWADEDNILLLGWVMPAIPTAPVALLPSTGQVFVVMKSELSGSCYRWGRFKML